MADSSNIDNAVIAKLLGDATLIGLMPDGVYWEEAQPGATRFVVVSLVDPHDTRMFGGRAFEENTYMVKAVAKSTSGGDVKAAAARIDALLENGSLSVSGYTLVSMIRHPDLARIRTTERDEADESILWQHRGGYYEVVVSA